MRNWIIGTVVAAVVGTGAGGVYYIVVPQQPPPPPSQPTTPATASPSPTVTPSAPPGTPVAAAVPAPKLLDRGLPEVLKISLKVVRTDNPLLSFNWVTNCQLVPPMIDRCRQSNGGRSGKDVSVGVYLDPEGKALGLNTLDGIGEAGLRYRQPYGRSGELLDARTLIPIEDWRAGFTADLVETGFGRNKQSTVVGHVTIKLEN